MGSPPLASAALPARLGHGADVGLVSARRRAGGLTGRVVRGRDRGWRAADVMNCQCNPFAWRTDFACNRVDEPGWPGWPIGATRAGCSAVGPMSAHRRRLERRQMRAQPRARAPTSPSRAACAAPFRLLRPRCAGNPPIPECEVNVYYRGNFRKLLAAALTQLDGDLPRGLPGRPPGSGPTAVGQSTRCSRSRATHGLRGCSRCPARRRGPRGGLRSCGDRAGGPRPADPTRLTSPWIRGRRRRGEGTTAPRSTARARMWSPTSSRLRRSGPTLKSGASRGGASQGRGLGRPAGVRRAAGGKGAKGGRQRGGRLKGAAPCLSLFPSPPPPCRAPCRHCRHPDSQSESSFIQVGRCPRTRA